MRGMCEFAAALLMALIVLLLVWGILAAAGGIAGCLGWT